MMMSALLNKVKAQHLEARKARDGQVGALLSSLVAGAQLTAKNDGNRAVTDTDVIKSAKALLKSATENLALFEGRSADATGVTDPVSAAVAKREIEILSKILPSQMSDADLQTVVQETIKKVGATTMKDMGRVMAALKAEREGQYDGGQANALVKEALWP
jgi:uncharacterized protein YqeY